MGRDLSIAPGRSVLYSFLAAPLLLLPVLALDLPLHHWQGNWPLPEYLLGCLAIVAGMPAHEALHALGWRRWGGAPPEAIRFGASRYVLSVACTQPVAAGVYRRIVALPGLVLGVLPCLAAIVSGNDLVLFFGLAHLSGAAGDALILWQVRGLPGAARVRDHGSRVGCILVADGGSALDG